MIDAIYRDGVLVPVSPVDLAPETRLRLHVGADARPPAGLLADALLRALAGLRATASLSNPMDPALASLATVRSQLLLIVALLAAGIGQLTLHARPALGLALFTAGLIAFVCGALPALRVRALPIRAAGQLRLRRDGLFVALLLAAIGWAASGGNHFTAVGVLAWFGSLGLWLWAWWPSRTRASTATTRSLDGRLWLVAALAAVLAAAAVFRFAELRTLPPEMTSDHAEKLLDVRDVLMGDHRIFFPRNTGREPAQFYFTALLAGPLGFGLSYMALKFGTAIVGWLTVPLTYLMARRGAGAPQSVALIAAALLAVSLWHTEITRVGLRFPYAPFAVALTLTFALRALRSNDPRDWLLTGLALGLGLYGYTPFRAAVLVVALALPLGWLSARRARLNWGTAVTHTALVPFTAALAFLPLGHYALDQPDTFWFRSADMLPQGQTVDLWSQFWTNVWNAALMFHWRGDVVWVNTVPNEPVLDPITGAVFLLGVGFLAVRVLRLRQPVDLVLLMSLPILLLPSILALSRPGENPSVVRAGGALPVVVLVAAWPLAALASSLAGFPSRSYKRAAVIALTAVVIAGIGLQSWQTYTGEYRSEYEQTSWNSSEIAAVIRDLSPRIGGDEHAYVKSFPHWVDSRNVAFNLGDPDWNSVLVDNDITQLSALKRPEPRLVILNPRDDAALATLDNVWPGGESWLFQSRVPSKEFWVYLRPGYTR